MCREGNLENLHRGRDSLGIAGIHEKKIDVSAILIGKAAFIVYLASFMVLLI